jgi:hypothetical protein
MLSCNTIFFRHAGCLLQVRIEHGVDNNKVTTSPWTAEVQHNTASCNGVESVQLVATLTGLPSILSKSTSSLSVWQKQEVQHASSFKALSLCLLLKVDLALSQILCSQDRMLIEFSFLCTLRICCYAVRHYVIWCGSKEMRDVFGNVFFRA